MRFTDATEPELISTGFNTLDVALDGGLFEGLYVIGAISSLGKTTLAIQIADYLASQGRDVLYISLEMSRYEIMAKSISRHTLLYCKENGLDQKNRFCRICETHSALINKTKILDVMQPLTF